MADVHPKVKELLGRTYHDQRSEAWLQLREGMLTASDVATALGENHYETPDKLLMKKVLKLKWSGNAATAHGTLLEPIARDLYDARYNKKSHEIGLVQHPVHKWLGGSPDGVTEDGMLIEIKCPLTRKIESKVPKHYMPQIQLLLEILDLEECDFIQYRPAGTIRKCDECRACNLGVFGTCDCTYRDVPDPSKPEEFNVVNVKRSRQWFADALPIMQAFWERVQAAKRNGLCEVEADSTAYTPLNEYICYIQSE
jgi:putative phage-type endonuclease